MKGGVDQGFCLDYCKLSFRRKFIRNLWMLLPLTLAYPATPGSSAGTYTQFDVRWDQFYLVWFIYQIFALIYSFARWKFVPEEIGAKWSHTGSYILFTGIFPIALLVVKYCDLGVPKEWDISSVASVFSSSEDAEPEEASFRVFTSSNGKTIKGRIIAINGSKVSLEREDGKIFKVPMNKFSADDRDYIRESQALEGLESKPRLASGKAATPEEMRNEIKRFIRKQNREAPIYFDDIVRLDKMKLTKNRVIEYYSITQTIPESQKLFNEIEKSVRDEIKGTDVFQFYEECQYDITCRISNKRGRLIHTFTVKF